ncbi:MAG: hypothetical protein FWG50_06790 [Kiritimatiellaeota bacterium]|nr:hypothetical protein [Kiritimatiellota bacterium]
MTRKRYLIIVTVLFCAVCVWFLWSDKRKSLISDDTPNKVEKIRRLPPKGNVFPLKGHDDVDIEIEGHGYRPSSKQEREELRKSYLLARDGANVKLTFHVMDSKGQDVPNALVRACFLKNDDRKGETDENGLFTTEGKTDHEMIGFVKKEGHYDTRVVYSLDPEGQEDVKNGKWVPWHRTVEVTLKEKRNPIPMYVKEARIFLPRKGEAFGYDFEKGDLVAPYGKGEQADLSFMCLFEERGDLLDYKSELFITAAQEGGIILNAKDKASQFVSKHEAQEDGYEPQFYLVRDRVQSKVLQNIELEENEYLTFRSRVTRDNDGNIISANFGKVYRISYGRRDATSGNVSVTLVYYFNPTPNDRNLEFDPDKNLFEERKRGGVYLSP